MLRTKDEDGGLYLSRHGGFNQNRVLYLLVNSGV